MTVGELLARLECFDPDTKVFVDTGDGKDDWLEFEVLEGDDDGSDVIVLMTT